MATVFSSTEVDLAWTNNSQAADGYTILSSVGGAAFTAIGTVDADTNTFSDTSLSPSETVQYEVQASGITSDVVSSPATSQTVTTPTGVPVIISLVQGPDNDTYAVLTYSYQGSDYSSFEVEMEDTSVPGENFSLVEPDSSGATTDSSTNTLTITDTFSGLTAAMFMCSACAWTEPMDRFLISCRIR